MIAPLFARGKDRHRETSQSTTHILYLKLPFHVLAKLTLLANSKYIKPFQVEDQFWSASSPSFPLSGFQAPGSCSIMTPAEGISSLVAIICTTLASAEMLSPGQPLALMDYPPGQHLLRGLSSHLVSSHTIHIFSPRLVSLPRDPFRPTCSCSASWLTSKSFST